MNVSSLECHPPKTMAISWFLPCPAVLNFTSLGKISETVLVRNFSSWHRGWGIRILGCEILSGKVIAPIVRRKLYGTIQFKVFEALDSRLSYFILSPGDLIDSRVS